MEPTRSVPSWRDDAVLPGERARPVPPPRPLLVLAAGIVAAAALLWLLAVPAAHGAGYVLSTFGGLGTIAWFTTVDLRRRQSPFYTPDRRLGSYRLALAVAAVAVASTHVWVLATWLAS